MPAANAEYGASFCRLNILYGSRRLNYSEKCLEIINLPYIFLFKSDLNSFERFPYVPYCQSVQFNYINTRYTNLTILVSTKPAMRKSNPSPSSSSSSNSRPLLSDRDDNVDDIDVVKGNAGFGCSTRD